MLRNNFRTKLLGILAVPLLALIGVTAFAGYDRLDESRAANKLRASHRRDLRGRRGGAPSTARTGRVGRRRRPSDRRSRNARSAPARATDDAVRGYQAARSKRR